MLIFLKFAGFSNSSLINSNLDINSNIEVNRVLDKSENVYFPNGDYGTLKLRDVMAVKFPYFTTQFNSLFYKNYAGDSYIYFNSIDYDQNKFLLDAKSFYSESSGMYDIHILKKQNRLYSTNNLNSLIIYNISKMNVRTGLIIQNNFNPTLKYFNNDINKLGEYKLANGKDLVRNFETGYVSSLFTYPNCPCRWIIINDITYCVDGKIPDFNQCRDRY